jgi:hypothetical protein
MDIRRLNVGYLTRGGSEILLKFHSARLTVFRDGPSAQLGIYLFRIGV